MLNIATMAELLESVVLNVRAKSATFVE
jgi:hypothetical protein